VSHPIQSSKSPTRTQGAKLEGYVARHGEFRNRILDAAEVLIAETGDTSFATRELAIRAGVSAATPFNHFGSKRGILSAIVDRSLERLATRREHPTRLGDPLERIFRNADAAVSYYAAKPKLFRPVFGELIGKPVSGEVAGNEAISRYHTLQQANTTWRLGLDAAAEAGQLRRGHDLDVIANQLEANWLGSLVLWIIGRVDGDGWKLQSEYGTALTLASVVAAEELDRLGGRITKLERRLARLAGPS
jgi:AcrR family transcriptional regulator